MNNESIPNFMFNFFNYISKYYSERFNDLVTGVSVIKITDLLRTNDIFEYLINIVPHIDQQSLLTNNNNLTQIQKIRIKIALKFY